MIPVLAVFLAGCSSLALRGCAEPWQPPPKPASPTLSAYPAPTACADHDPHRRAYFGDLHVHTGYSFDARSYDVLATPDDAYRFARGEEIALWPYAPEGMPGRSKRLERPLDFAAVTDHAEWMGETTVCTDDSFAGYTSEGCRRYRGDLPPKAPLPGFPTTRMLGLVGVFDRRSDVCGEDKSQCRHGILSAWRSTQDAAERWQDRSDSCSFTTFHGWEWSFSPGRAKVHRNVVFRNHIVPELPISSLEEPKALRLWERLAAECNDNGSGCEAMTIPHNPNVSNGRMFSLRYGGESLEEQRRQAALQARIEPLVEMMQIKGESECRSGMHGVVGEDEFCGFEKLRSLGAERYPDCEEGYGVGAIAGWGCESRLDYARYVIVEGLREEQRLGVNPYKLGFIGGTDTHNATPGDVSEDGWKGCCGNEDGSIESRLSDTPIFANKSNAWRNPGGLMGVWAEENSRDSLFDAMKRKETFSTSGPRIRPRLFGGWTAAESICDHKDFAAQAYQRGVPMGSALGPRPDDGTAPVFIASALRDPGTDDLPGGLLQRLQIVKVWADDEQRFQQRVYDIAGTTGGGADVDLETCHPRGSGHDSLCTTWTDPSFEPERHAAYYLRVLENPSCRWSWRQCLEFPANARPPACADPQLARTIQERAWSSPIWYTPPSD